METAFVPNSDKPLINGLEDVIAYEQEKPWTERFPLRNSYEILGEAANRYTDATAFHFLLIGEPNEAAVTISFNELFAKVTQSANCFRSLGVQKDDAVAIMLTNLLHSHYAIWGAQVAGIAAPLNPLLESSHLIEIMNTTKAKVFVTLSPLVADKTHWQRVETILDNVPSLEKILLVEIPGYTETGFELKREGLEVQNYDEAIGAQPADALNFEREIKGDDIAAYFHTGGTTGRPKIAQVTHLNIAWSGQIVDELVRYKGRIVGMSALPLFHIYGLIAAGIATLFAGRTIVMMTPDGFRNPNVLRHWWHHAARFEVNAFAAVPTILAALLQVPVGDNDLSHLEDVGSGAAPLPKQLRREFEQTYHVRVSNGWGMTETCSLGTRQRAEVPAPEGSVGTRFPYCQIKTAELDGNRIVRECAPNESGVLLLKGPNIFKGYLHPEDDAKAWVDGDWFNTGDVAFVDEEGFVTLTGRAKDLIIRGGHNIDPVIIEEPLSKHPAVAQVVAIGQPDAYAGELPVVYIELRPEYRGKISVEELQDFCAKNIPERAAVPKRIDFVDAMPVTAVGKFFKPALRNLAIEHVLREALSQTNIAGEIEARFEQSRGHVAQVSLRNNADLDKAREALEKFPLEIDFS